MWIGRRDQYRRRELHSTYGPRHAGLCEQRECHIVLSDTRQMGRPVGAIVIDETTGDTGTIKGRASKSEAVRDATRDCEMYGATHCELMVAYYNQCAAIATTHHRFSWGRAGTEEQAKQEAVRSCETDSSQCEVAYSACSLPKRID